MYLYVKSGKLVFRKHNRENPLVIADMTDKIYDWNDELVKIITVLNSKSRTFEFTFAEVTRPVFKNFNAMVLWFEDNVKLSTGGTTNTTGLVPYTGATTDVDLGIHSITASNVSGNNTGDQVGDGVTITGTGTSIDPFVAASEMNIEGGSSNTIYLTSQIINGGTA